MLNRDTEGVTRQARLSWGSQVKTTSGSMVVVWQGKFSQTLLKMGAGVQFALSNGGVCALPFKFYLCLT